MRRMLARRLFINFIAFIGLFICILIFYLFTSSSSVDSIDSGYLDGYIQPHAPNSDKVHPRETYRGFPMMVHNTWKSKSISMPRDLKRWVSSCQNVNRGYDFRLYDDIDLHTFVKAEYPEYLAFFETLHGVYMADMARLLLIYHYGGIYMDTDFYCYRPINCLIDKVLNIIQTHSPFQRYINLRQNAASSHTLSPNGSDGKPSNSTTNLDILVVSLEPMVHANLFRNSHRVLIQDFFLSTPKHPFFKWLLDIRNNESKMANYSFIKGPFSYAIEKDVDQYRQIMIKNSIPSRRLHGDVSSKGPSSSRRLTGRQGDLTFINGVYNSTAPPKDQTLLSKESYVYTKDSGLILELREDVLHPLIDSTNSRLYSVCQEEGANPSKKSACDIVSHGEFFRPSGDTIAVHMWSHVYLGWNFIRGFYNWRTYSHVESALPSTSKCSK